MDKKALSAAAILICAITLSCLSLGWQPFHAQAADGQSVPFSGYLESASGWGLTLADFEDKVFTTAKIDGTTRAFSLDGNRIILPNAGTYLMLGSTYELALSGTDGDYITSFMYVTKAIKTADELGVFNRTAVNQVIDGYYVLANDIEYDAEFTNTHPLYNTNYNIDSGGFKGTFDGLGRKMSFNSGPYGLFARLLGGAVIKNVAMYDIMVNTSPVIAFQANQEVHEQSGLHKTVENVYISIMSGIPRGIIYTIDNFVTLTNIIVEYSLGIRDYNTKDGVGTLCGADQRRNVANRSKDFSNVYLISKTPVCRYMRTQELTVLDRDTYYIIYAENENVPNEHKDGSYQYENIRKYDTLLFMKDDVTNDYSAFNNYCWDTVSFGLPVWAGLKTDQYKVTFNGELRPRISLYLNGEPKTAEFAVTFSGILTGIVPEIEIKTGESCVKVQDNKVTAKAVGIAELEAVFTVENQERRQNINITVREQANDYVPPSKTFMEKIKPYLPLIISVPLLMAAAVVAVLIVKTKEKRKKREPLI